MASYLASIAAICAACAAICAAICAQPVQPGSTGKDGAEDGDDEDGSGDFPTPPCPPLQPCAQPGGGGLQQPGQQRPPDLVLVLRPSKQPSTSGLPLAGQQFVGPWRPTKAKKKEKIGSERPVSVVVGAGPRANHALRMSKKNRHSESSLFVVRWTRLSSF